MTRRPKIVILGGGMAGLTTAWELSRGAWRDRFESIRVYQRGWRLGGKGASSRGVHGRIEEHGLHVLLGYYETTFEVLREVYEELDRAQTDPSCPFRTIDDAVKPASAVGLAERTAGGGWNPWSMSFPARPGRPGDGTRSRLQPLEVALHSIRLLASFYAAHARDSAPAVKLSARPIPAARDTPDPSVLLRGMGHTVLAGLVEALASSGAAMTSAAPAAVAEAVDHGVTSLRAALAEILSRDHAGDRTWTLVDLAVTNVKGIVADRLLSRREGFGAIDDLDYREWLERHGAAPETRDCAIVRGMYDLVFAYRGGDRSRPAFAAGLGIELASQMLFQYKGALFWKMQAGMGEIFFAPLYQALAARGVEFEFFHRVDDVQARDGRVTTIKIGRQVDLRDPSARYAPLIRVRDIPAWPAAPDATQLAGAGEWLLGAESYDGERRDAAAVSLMAGVDFDVVVLAASLGIVPLICPQLLRESRRWREMVENVETVATRAFQLWLGATEAELGWPGGAGVTLSAYAEPFDTWASMSHLIEYEDWPAEARPRSIAYFCSSMPDRAHRDADSRVKAEAVEFLRSAVGTLWPRAASPAGFRWELLSGARGAGDEAFDSQYWRANVDPSDRYVQSLPGTGRYRIAPGDTDFANLVVAGDWTSCGLDAGCIEAATRSGVLAARAIIENLAKEKPA